MQEAHEKYAKLSGGCGARGLCCENRSGCRWPSLCRKRARSYRSKMLMLKNGACDGGRARTDFDVGKARRFEEARLPGAAYVRVGGKGPGCICPYAKYQQCFSRCKSES